MLTKMVAAYPGVDVPAEMQLALSKLRDGIKELRTPERMPTFLYSWLDNAKRGGRATNGRTPGIGQATTAPEYPEDPDAAI